MPQDMQVHAEPAPSHRATFSIESLANTGHRVRTVHFNLPSSHPDAVGEEHFVNNYVRTARYTFYNFLFINLFEQFGRIANLYFLLIAVLQLVPGLSPTHWFTTVAPLIFVLFVNAVKEIYDDYYRHKSDDEVNNRLVERFNQGSNGRMQTKWRDLRVGDVVMVEQDSEIPADLVFLSSSDPEGLCFVETANLDGETNLKLKYCFNRTARAQSTADLEAALDHRFIECELPNEKLYQFDGSVVATDQEREGLDASNLLLRGSSLRKTAWVIGVVVFAGIDSKIQRNQSTGKKKITQLERHMNILVIVVFVVQVVLALIGAVGREVWLDQHADDYYLEATNGWPDLGKGVTGGAVTVLRFVILLNQLIPISLYVTLEVVKVIQCIFLNWDRQMYHKDSDTPFVCRTTTLNEDLGQVQYILSDKTGTLTQNVMGWVWASINGQLYGREIDEESSRAEIKRDPHTIVYDRGLLQALSSDEDAQKTKDASQFLLNLAVCNTVVPTMSPHGDVQYQAESPDEEALVQGAASLGFKLVSRTTERVEVEVHGKLLAFDVLAVLEFSSDRKRMSILCRTPNGRLRLYSKGADAVILNRLAPDQSIANSTTGHLNMMAAEGFRTLAVAQKDLTESEYQQWNQDFHLASVALNNREEQICRMAELIEKDLMLIGATAVEDKLQVGVPDAIHSLSSAGIKIWVLTGDKLETAVSISYSCSLFHPKMDLVYVKESEFLKQKNRKFFKVKENEVDEKLLGGSAVGLVVEGGVLTYALKPYVQEQFLEMCQKCQAVVCCRVSPIQKAQVTNLVRKKAKAIALAIGDGANDVGMIQAAHIGVGISGREGRAAVLSSDFAMAQFRFLKRLLLVHGRWSYKRNSEVVLYAFYKNFAYCLANVYLNFFYAGFSSQPVYGSALIATYNLFWTSLPTIGFAILEQDVTADTVISAPKLYGETMRANRRLFFKDLARWLLEGIWHSIVAFLLPLYALCNSAPNGKMIGIDEMGVAVYTAVIVLVNLKIALRTQHWTNVNVIFVFLISIALWFPFLLTCSYVWKWYGYLPEMSGVAIRLFDIPSFWLSAVIAAPICGMFLDATLVAFENRFWPKDVRIYQECERKGMLPESDSSKDRSVTASESGLIHANGMSSIV